MSNAAVETPTGDLPEPQPRHLVSVPVSGWRLPEMTVTDARRLAVALLLEAERIDPAPRDHGRLPYGWTRLSLIVPELETAPVVDLVKDLKRNGLGRARISQELNARELTTQTGGPWHPPAVARLLAVWPLDETRKRWTVPTVQRLL